MKTSTFLNMKKITLTGLLTLLILLFATTKSYSQAAPNTTDGYYCPGPGEILDEYADAFTFMPGGSATGTCAVLEAWALIDYDDEVIRLGFMNGNSGAAIFRIYLDTDDDPTTGLTMDTFGGGPITVPGIEIILQIFANTGVTTFFEWDVNSQTMIEIIDPQILITLFGGNGNSDGCNGSDGQFFEFNIPFSVLDVDLCDPQAQMIRIGHYAAVSGGSTNSSMCSNIPLDFDIDISGVVTPDQTLCVGEDIGELTLEISGQGNTIEGWQTRFNGGAWTPIVNFLDTYTPAGLLVGVHEFRAVLSNENVCPDTDFFSSAATITIAAVPTVNILASGATCQSGNDGTVTASASGGTSPYSYNLLYSANSSGPYSNHSATDGDSDGSYTGLGAGFYEVEVTDDNGCSSTSSEIEVVDGDGEAPTGSAPAGTTGIDACAADALSAVPAFDPIAAAAGYSDNVSAVTATLTNTADSGTDCNWSVTYTFTVSDVCDNELTGQTITHTGSDQTAPIGTAPTGVVDVDVCAANAQTDYPFVPATVATNYSDNCLGAVTVNLTGTNQTGDDCGWTLVYTYEVVDVCGNKLENETLTHTGSDQTAPIGTAPTGVVDVDVCAANAQTDYPFVPATVATNYSDNCLGAVTVNLTGTNQTGDDCGWTLVYTYEVVDVCGNKLENETLTHTGSDQTAPNGTAPTGVVDVDVCAANAQTDYPFVSATVATNYSDNCLGAVTVNLTGTNQTGDDCGWTLVYTYEVVDVCGNKLENETLTHTGSDQTAPNGTAPTGVVDVDVCAANAQTDYPFVPATVATNYSDNCLGAVTVNLTGTNQTGDDCGWTLVYTYEVVDVCGNKLENETITHTGSDQTAPIGTAPTGVVDVDVCAANAQTDYPFVPATVATNYSDNCLGAVTVNLTGTNQTGDDCGWTLVYTYEVVDVCGNKLENETLTHTGSDQTAPNGTAPTGVVDVDVCAANAQTDYPFVPATVATNYSDNCLGAVTVNLTGTNQTGDDCGWTLVYTYEVVDVCGNKLENETITHTGSDQTAPVIAALPGSTTIECPATPSFASATATDACDATVTLTFADVTTPGSCAAEYSITRTWTATDTCGNTSTKSQTITVQDSTAPILTIPANASIECDQDNSPDGTAGWATATDNCDSSVSATYIDDNCFGTQGSVNLAANPAGSTFEFDISELPAIYTAKDIEKLALSFYTNHGVGKAEFWLIAPSGQAVILIGPYCNGTLECDKTGNFDVNFSSDSNLTVWDNTTTAGSGDYQPYGATTSVNSVPGVTALVQSFDDFTGDMNGTWRLWGRKESNDGGLGVVIFNSVCLTPALNECENSEIIVRVWTATDACGNSTTGNQIIVIEDTTGPTITDTPSAITYDCAEEVPTADINSVNATDNCAGDVTITVADVVTPGSCVNRYSIVRTWTATDVCGNSSYSSQTITVDDQTSPVITGTPSPITYDCAEDVPTASIASVSATDNCIGSVTIEVNDVVTSGSCVNRYSIERTWTATDVCGNFSTSSQTITVDDQTAPIITCPSNIIVTADAGQPDADVIIALPTVSDNCDGDVTYSNDYTEVEDASGTYNLGTTTVTYTATDNCGNTAQCSFTVTVNDEESPEITCPPTITVSCIDLVLAAYVSYDEFVAAGGSATDNNGIDETSFTLVSETSDSNTCPETISRVYRISDNDGNSSDCTQTIIVNDEIDPTASNLPPVNVECLADVPAFNIDDVTDEADNCTANPVVAFVSDVSDGNTCAEVITRTYSVTDDCGNAINVTQTITIDDVTPPTASNLAPVNVECLADVPAFNIDDVTDEADNCTANPVVAHVSDVSDNNTCAEVITRTYSVTDDCGNFINVTQTITIDDITNPTASNPEPINVECIEDVPAFDISVVTDEADNCTANPVVAHVSDVSDNNTCAEVITRTYSVTDDCGNFINVTQTITINDITNPTASNPEPINVECIEDVPAFDSSVVTDEADNCTANPVVAHVSDVSDNNTCAEVITRTYSVTDDCGNFINVTQTITIDDITNPTASNPEPINVECIEDVPAFDISVVTDEADNCIANPVVAHVSDVSDNNTCAEVITRTYSVTDDCGNFINVTQTITIDDITNPTASNPEPINVECIEDVPAFDISVVTDEADNCTANPVVAHVSDVSDNNTCAEVITRTYSVTDDCGNFINVTQTITINDITNPTFTVPESITIECDIDNQDLTLTGDVTDEADNCSASLEATFTDSTEDGECPGNYIITRTWTLEDECGNTTTMDQTITVEDTTPPELITNLPTTLTATCDDIPAAPSPGFADNCTENVSVVFMENITIIGSMVDDYDIVRTWTVTDECDNTAVFTQIVTVSIIENITQIADSICFDNGSIDLDDYLSDIDQDVSWEVVSGGASLDGSILDPLNLELEDYVFSYTYAEVGGCLSTTELTITVDDSCIVLACEVDDVIISKAVTPNGDQWNEYFEITGVEGCGFTYELQIFNRWGAKIYENFNYQNDWNGTAHKNSIGSSDKVPSGTYYYILKLTNSSDGLELKPFTGPIYVGTK